MKTLHTYPTRQVLATLVLTVMVFTFVLLLASVVKEILALLVTRQATLGIVAEALALLIPWVLAFALPMGMLTATLLVFGRFSADQELTAVRASGVSLVSLITPVLMLSVAFSCVCAMVNLQIAPLSRVAYKRLLSRMVEDMAVTILPEKTFIKEFPGYLIYLGRVDGGELKDVQVYTLDAEGKVESQLRAPSGSIVVNRAEHTITMMLRNVWRTGLIDGKRAPPIGIEQTTLPPLKLPDEKLERTKLSDMTFLQLQDELQELERRTSGSGSMRGLSREQMVERLRQLAQQRTDLTTPVKVQMHRQVSFSFACFGFTLIGIPLAIRAHRRETNIGIAMALVLVLIYYSFIILGQSLQTRPEFFPHLIVWAPNFIFQSVGAVLLWRGDRGGGVSGGGLPRPGG